MNLLGISTLENKQTNIERPMKHIIDFETHFQATRYVKEITNWEGYPRYTTDLNGSLMWLASPTRFERRDGLQQRLENLEERIVEMDKNGIDMQVISSSNPSCEMFPKDKGISLARINNDGIAESCARYPDRFIGLASLPLQDIDAALEELDHARSIGARGVIVYSNCNGKYTDADEFWPIYERAARLRFPIFLHPTAPADPHLYSDYNMWGPVFGFGADAAYASLKLIMSGLLEKYSQLRIVLGHLGETIPYVIRRIDFAFLRSPQTLPRIRQRPSEYFLQNFFVTTSGMYNEPSLICAYNTLSEDRIVFGSDYPFESVKDGINFVKNSNIDEFDKNRIFWKNAADLLGIRT